MYRAARLARRDAVPRVAATSCAASTAASIWPSSRATLRARKNRALMLDGVTLEDPATTYIDDDVTIGADTIIGPGVLAGGRDDDWRALPHSRRRAADERDDRRRRDDARSLGDRRLDASTTGAQRSARSRTCGPDSIVGEDARVGNFVELKKTRLGRGSKANHLAYLGDATIGEDVNIGAGTITCNYDGVEEASDGHRGRRLHRQRLAARRAGARSASGAYVAAGSSITEDVPRRRARRSRAARQENKPGWAADAARAHARREEALSHVRHRRIRRSEAARCPSSWRACGGSNTAATTRPASPSCATAQMRDPPQRRQAVATSRTCSRSEPLDGEFGIGHTRWATHGRPTEENAHPHRDCTAASSSSTTASSRTTSSSSSELTAEGHTFVTETDTEIVAHLVEKESRGDGLAAAVRRALHAAARPVRARADLGRRSRTRSSPCATARRSSSGLGEDEFFVASDIPAILGHTRDVVFLDDREMAVVTRAGVDVHGLRRARRSTKSPQHITWDPVMAEKAGYAHFMLKEIHEQPWAVRETVLGRTSAESGRVFLEEMQLDAATLAAIERVVILACGTSWHAGLVGKFLIEELARVPVEVDYSSEFRYRQPIVDTRTLAVAITQSGETADTLGALREAKRLGARSIAICNVVGSMATREADGTHLHARRARDRRRVDQGVHVAARRAASARARARPGARHAVARRVARTLLRGARAAAASASRRRSRSTPAIEALAQRRPPAARFPVPRPRHQLSDRARRRAEAEGDLVHPRRGLSGRRDEARPDRAHRRGPAGGRPRGRRRRVREGAGQHPGSQGARRAGHRGDERVDRRRRSTRSCDQDRDVVLAVPDAHPLLLPVLLAIPLQLLAYHVAVAARVRRRSAEESREERDGRVSSRGGPGRPARSASNPRVLRLDAVTPESVAGSCARVARRWRRDAATCGDREQIVVGDVFLSVGERDHPPVDLVEIVPRRASGRAARSASARRGGRSACRARASSAGTPTSSGRMIS